MTTSPFGGPPAVGPEAPAMGPFEAAALARGPLESEDAPFGALPDEPPAAGTSSPFGTVPAPRPAGDTAAAPAAEVTEPAGLRARPTRPERPGLGLPSRAAGGGTSRRGPLLVLALGGGALVLWALVAGTLLSGGGDDADASGVVVV